MSHLQFLEAPLYSAKTECPYRRGKFRRFERDNALPESIQFGLQCTISYFWRVFDSTTSFQGFDR